MYRSVVMPFLIAVQFLTTIPIRLPSIPSTKQNALSVLFYPVVGLMIGGVLSFVSLVALPILPLSCFVLVVWVVLTGGLHLDGLADTADAWVGGLGNRERTLAIMKDPHIGAMGVIAMVLCLAVKWACLHSLLDVQAIWALFFVPMLGRLSVLLFFATTLYIRKNGLGSALQTVPKGMLWTVLVGFTVSLFVLSWQVAMGVLAGWLLLFFVLRFLFIRCIGGMTGDTIGAGIEVIEGGLLLVCVGLLN